MLARGVPCAPLSLLLHSWGLWRLHGEPAPTTRSQEGVGSELPRMQCQPCTKGHTSLGSGVLTQGRVLHPTAELKSFSTEQWRLVKSHLESRLSDSVGWAWRPRCTQALLHTVCLAGGI